MVYVGPVDVPKFVALERICLLQMLRSVGLIVGTLMHAVSYVEIGTRLDWRSSGGVSGIEARFTHSKNYTKNKRS